MQKQRVGVSRLARHLHLELPSSGLSPLASCEHLCTPELKVETTAWDLGVPASWAGREPSSGIQEQSAPGSVHPTAHSIVKNQCIGDSGPSH